MRLLTAAIVGLVVGTAAWRSTVHVFAQPLFARRNHRGIEVPVGTGILLAVAAVAGEAVFVVVDAVADELPVDRPARLAVVVAAVGFSLLGFLDDIAASGDDRGFRGHLRVMAAAKLTTGGLKLVGGGLLAIVVASIAGGDGLGQLALNAALIALGANLGNLFDRAPGRTIKVGVVTALVLLVGVGADDRALLTGVSVLVGAALALLVHDLREELMLGDAGSNVIGAVVATGLVAAGSTTTRVVALVVVLALNLASEKVSFSKVIDSVAPLRALDRLGRRG